MRASVAYGAALLALAFASSRASAETTSSVALEWSAPPGCPGREYVLAATTRILGQSKGARQAVAARATVSHVAHQRWQVSLTTRTGDSEGERTLDAPSCEALADTVGLILALAASPETSPPVVAAPQVPLPAASVPSTAGAPPIAAPAAPPAVPPVSPAAVAPSAVPSPPVTPSPVTPSPVTPSPVTPSPVTPSPTPASRAGLTPHHLLAALSAAGSLGSLPSVAVGGEAAIGVRFWHVRAEIAASYWGPQTSTLSVGAVTSSSHFTLIASDLRAGYVISLGRLDVVPTLVGGVDVSHATASNLGSSSSPSTAWLSLGGGGWIYWNLTRSVALRLGVEALVPVARPIFQIKDPTAGSPQRTVTPFEPSAVAGEGTLGAEVHFL